MAARYRIRVRGRLDAGWSSRMAGLRISAEHASGGLVTTLEGAVRDQAELTGVLNTLSDLNLPLVSVLALADAGSEGSGSSRGASPKAARTGHTPAREHEEPDDDR